MGTRRSPGYSFSQYKDEREDNGRSEIGAITLTGTEFDRKLDKDDPTLYDFFKHKETGEDHQLRAETRAGQTRGERSQTYLVFVSLGIGRNRMVLLEIEYISFPNDTDMFLVC
jgi:hypothetical protein